ncbi:MAG: ATPase, partial [Chloroflexota bacterium]|nr:ATPase [Chloroflexota bacterium]
MTDTDIVIGVDAGGSKTRVVVATSAGETLAEVVGPAAAMSPGNAEQSATVIAELVASALASGEQGDRVPRALYAGVAGTGR